MDMEHARPLRILCQSGQDLSLTVRDGTAVLARADDKDQRQCWVQSFRNTGRVTDYEGHLAFALVNWATGKALQRQRQRQRAGFSFFFSPQTQVGLVGHRPDSVDVALLWTQSEDLGEGFHGLRSVTDVGFVLDAANAVPEAGGAHDGTPILVFPWNGGHNQKWKMVPFY
ncbi:ricin B-like lectin R40G2 [Miscanthus floridulus]|uniref:ricin B-like lectin R40G2 n=1 Tax=Miscanthus floridulus TaxID=154761 RepID=UPI003459405E